MKKLFRFIGLLTVSFLAVQLFFLSKVVLMLVVSPESTSFQRSEAWRIVTSQGELPWRQEWVNYSEMSNGIKQAVIASEDGDFVNHDGVEWDAIESAWYKNAKAEERALQRSKNLQNRRKNTVNTATVTKLEKPVKIIGGSTITQQLAKNLFLSGERNFVRKGQEFVVTQFLELVLSKRQILTIYLNNVEWGEGVFGAEAAAQHYFRKPAKQLSSYESARLAVMLPRPKFFEKQSGSSYLSGRASSIVARMPDAELPD
ncbi:MAG: transglycosylase domain-containing protein [Burkholderiaceae bacterium]